MFKRPKTRVALIVGAVACLGLGAKIAQMLWSPAADSPTGDYTFVLEPGDTFYSIGRELESENIVRSDFDTALKLLPKDTLHEGEYTLQLPASARSVVAQLNAQAAERGQELMARRPKATRVQIQEGWSVERIANELVEQGILEDTDEFLRLATMPGNFEYEFLPTPLSCSYGARANCVVYYLEGYLYPDTYELFQDSTAREVLTKLLDTFESRVRAKYPDVPLSEFSRAVAMGSVVEVETGRPVGIAGESPQVLEDERRQVASVFYNRMEVGMEWKSDPTVSYLLPGKVCQQTTAVSGCVFLNDRRAQTRYNTYRNPGYPVGPIGNPRLSSIEAALQPAQTDYLFFVADNRGVTRFAETGEGHFRNIRDVQNGN